MIGTRASCGAWADAAKHGAEEPCRRRSRGSSGQQWSGSSSRVRVRWMSATAQSPHQDGAGHRIVAPDCEVSARPQCSRRFAWNESGHPLRSSDFGGITSCPLSAHAQRRKTPCRTGWWPSALFRARCPRLLNAGLQSIGSGSERWAGGAARCSPAPAQALTSMHIDLVARDALAMGWRVTSRAWVRSRWGSTRVERHIARCEARRGWGVTSMGSIAGCYLASGGSGSASRGQVVRSGSRRRWAFMTSSAHA